MAMLSNTPSADSCITCKLSYHLAIGLFFDNRYSLKYTLPPNMIGLN